jgi:hypothetical protein
MICEGDLSGKPKGGHSNGTSPAQQASSGRETSGIHHPDETLGKKKSETLGRIFHTLWKITLSDVELEHESPLIQWGKKPGEDLVTPEGGISI